MHKVIWRAIAEMGVIIFLSYSVLLMAELTQSRMGSNNDLLPAVIDIFSAANFIIAVVVAFVGFFVVEILRRKL